MSEPFLGQIEFFGFNYAPKNWFFCAGQLLPISQYTALFSLLGTTYGGNGTTTFKLPDLRSRVPMGQGNGNGLTPRNIGDTGGEEQHTLLIGETPKHNHNLMTAKSPVLANNSDTPGPTMVLAQTTGKNEQGQSIPVDIYVTDSNPNQTLAPSAVGATGGMAHENRMPYLAGNFCICMSGFYPSRN